MRRALHGPGSSRGAGPAPCRIRDKFGAWLPGSPVPLRDVRALASAAARTLTGGGSRTAEPPSGGVVLRRPGRPPELPERRRPQAGARCLPLRRRGPPRPVPRQRRPLHHPPDRGGRPVRRLAARCAGHHGRADARRDGGLRHHQERADRALRRTDGRPGGRPHQARQAAVLDPRGRPGRELPQDAARDGARRAGDPDQARRPPAQHAHDGRDGRGQALAASPARRSTSTPRSPTAWA